MHSSLVHTTTSSAVRHWEPTQRPFFILNCTWGYEILLWQILGPLPGTGVLIWPGDPGLPRAVPLRIAVPSMASAREIWH